MTRHVSEERLALYGSEDVGESASREIAGHLERCVECRRALDEFREVKSFVSSALKDPDFAELAQVRAGLMAKLRAPRGIEGRWAWWLAGAAAALVLFTPALHVGRRTTTTPMAGREVARSTADLRVRVAPVTIAAERPQLPRHGKRTRSYSAGLRGVTLLAGAHQPAIIKMRTDDPNVVILWQIGERSENE